MPQQGPSPLVSELERFGSDACDQRNQFTKAECPLPGPLGSVEPNVKAEFPVKWTCDAITEP
jgi:hypothetical protein